MGFLMKKTVFLFVFICICLSGKTFAQDKLTADVQILDGEKTNLSDLYSKGPLLVNFWALWCQPCRTEMKSLKNLYEKYSGKGLTVLGVNQDTPRSLAKVESFVKSYDIPYPIALDPDKELFEIFNGQVIPYSVLYNKEGRVIYKHTGYLPGDEIKIEEAIKEALGDTSEQ